MVIRKDTKEEACDNMDINCQWLTCAQCKSYEKQAEESVGWYKNLDQWYTCENDAIGNCKVKYSDTKTIYKDDMPYGGCECGCKYYTLDDYGYQHCTNCGFMYK